MEYKNSPHIIFGPQYEKLGEGVWVVGSRCLRCQSPIGEEITLALGPPYHGLLHERCAPYFHYSRQYPHQKPLESYSTLQLEQ